MLGQKEQEENVNFGGKSWRAMPYIMESAKIRLLSPVAAWSILCFSPTQLHSITVLLIRRYVLEIEKR